MVYPKYGLISSGNNICVPPVYATITGKLAIGGNNNLYLQAKSKTSSAKPKKTMKEIANIPDICDNIISGIYVLVKMIPKILKIRQIVAGTIPNDSGILILPASVPKDFHEMLPLLLIS